MALGVPHQLRRRVKTHGLGIEHTGQETGGLKSFEPSAHIGEQRKTGGVTLGKTVFAKTLNLLGCVAMADHLGNQWVVKFCFYSNARQDHGFTAPLAKAIPARFLAENLSKNLTLTSSDGLRWHDAFCKNIDISMIYMAMAEVRHGLCIIVSSDGNMLLVHHWRVVQNRS